MTFIKRLLLVIILLAILLVACQPTPAEVSPLLEEDYSAQEQEPQPAPNLAGLIWKAEPIFEYDSIRFCDLCGFFAQPGWMLVDVNTGEEIEPKMGHGGWIQQLLYDEDLNLFGIMHGFIGLDLHLLTANEFLSAFPQFAGSLNLFYGIVSTKVIRTDDPNGPPNYDLSQALTGRAALAVGTGFVTGFDFDGGEWHPVGNEIVYLGSQNFERHPYNRDYSIIAVRQGENWGIVDSTGNTIVPFVLEHAIVIDNYTAFAKYGGLYGILQVREGAPVREESPPNVPAVPNTPVQGETFDEVLARYNSDALIRMDAWNNRTANFALLSEWVERYSRRRGGRVEVLLDGGPFPSALYILEADGSATYSITIYVGTLDSAETISPPLVIESSQVIRTAYSYTFGADVLDADGQQYWCRAITISNYSFDFFDLESEMFEWPPDAPLPFDAQITPAQAQQRVKEMYAVEVGSGLPYLGATMYFRTVGARYLGDRLYYIVYGHPDPAELERGLHHGSVTAVSVDGRLVFMQSMVHGEWWLWDDAQQEIIAP